MYLRFLSTCEFIGPPSPTQCRIISALEEDAREIGKDIFVTSVEDGNRKPTDPHPMKRAFDIRVRDRTALEIRALYDRLKGKLGHKFTVLYEAPSKPTDLILEEIWYPFGKPSGPHIHIQLKIGYEYP